MSLPSLSQPTQPRLRCRLLGVALALALVAPAATGAQPAAQPTAQPTAQPDPGDPYILGAGDGLSLRFLAATELSGPFDLLSDGT
ncbi:MAG: hypothetical protein VKM34_09680, partial [Cyanobacteriota bacterium]|nr:hypothetical protein [Cyanobacteriota bacterium]